jgi:hypothetical protein
MPKKNQILWKKYFKIIFQNLHKKVNNLIMQKQINKHGL